MTETQEKFLKQLPENMHFMGVWRSYQKHFLEEISVHLCDNKLNVVAAPGAGKTTLGIELIKRLNRPALILAPTITIKNQWKQRILEGFLTPEDDSSWISTNIKDIKTITSSTYQSLHTIIKDNASKKIFIEELKKHGIKTLVLDESHHLRTEWYHSLDYFYKYKDDIQKLLWKHSKEAYERDISKSYYDCTNYYFEIEYNDEDILDENGNIIEKGLRKRGPEKNHRPDPIVEMGLLMDASGIPIAYDIFPGNESEKLSLRPLLKRTKAEYCIERTIVVADRGLNTSDNIYFLAGKNDEKKNQDGYVYGQSVRGADKEFKEWVLSGDGYKVDCIHENGQEIRFVHKSRTFAKEIKIIRDGKRKVKVNVCQKQMVYFSFKYLMKQRHDRNKMINKAKEIIKKPSGYTRATSYGAAGYINNIEYDKETGEIVTGKALSLNYEKIKEEEKLDGYYSIVTSEIELDDYEIRKIYRGLSKIEATFKISKSYFGTRPVYVWTREHIEGHFLTCFIGLVLVRLLERKLGYRYTVEQIIESTKRYNCINIDKNIYQFLYKDDVINTIGEVFKVDLNKKYEKREQIKKLLKY